MKSCEEPDEAARKEKRRRVRMHFRLDVRIADQETTSIGNFVGSTSHAALETQDGLSTRSSRRDGSAE